jgi:hypothetical protein
MPVGEAGDFGAETDGERLDSDPAPAGDQEMAEFVEKDDDGQYEQEADNRVKNHIVGPGKSVNEGFNQYIETS